MPNVSPASTARSIVGRMDSSVEIISPSMFETTITLRTMEDHRGGSLSAKRRDAQNQSRLQQTVLKQNYSNPRENATSTYALSMTTLTTNVRNRAATASTARVTSSHQLSRLIYVKFTESLFHRPLSIMHSRCDSPCEYVHLTRTKSHIFVLLPIQHTHTQTATKKSEPSKRRVRPKTQQTRETKQTTGLPHQNPPKKKHATTTTNPYPPPSNHTTQTTKKKVKEEEAKHTTSHLR